MKYLLAVLICAFIGVTQEVKPLSKARIDTSIGMLSPSGDCPPSLGGRLEEWCFVSTRCFDTTCTNGMAQNPALYSTDEGGKLIQILPIEYCESVRTTIQDTLFLWTKLRLKAAQKTCLDSIRGVVNSHQDTTSCYLSIMDQFTQGERERMAERVPFVDSLISPIAPWRYTCTQ